MLQSEHHHHASSSRTNRRPGRHLRSVGIALAVASVLALLLLQLRNHQFHERRLQAIGLATVFLEDTKDSWSSPLVWLAQEAAAQAPAQESLQALAQRMTDSALRDPLSRLVGGEPASQELINSAGLASVIEGVGQCRGRSAPAPAVETYLAGDFSGYLLTHQLLFARWLQDLGCALPQGWQERSQALVERLESEVRAHERFDDLFVEQLAGLVAAGAADRITSDLVERIVAAQESDGSFHDPSGRGSLTYQGETLEVEWPPLHVTLLALYVLAETDHVQRYI